MTPTRLEIVVSQLQNKGCEPDVGAAIGGKELDAFVRGICDQRTRHRQERLVERRDAIELAILPHQGQQPAHLILVADDGNVHARAAVIGDLWTVPIICCHLHVLTVLVTRFIAHSMS